MDSRLVDIVPGSRLAISPRMSPAACRLRAGVHERLQRAAAALPDGQSLLVLDALRTQARQFFGWNRRLVALARQHPQLELAALTEMCRRDVADPVNAPSGHQSGAAIDVTLTENGVELDMGNTYGDFSSRGTASDRVRTDCAELTPAQRANRRRLADALAVAGFVNYPEEWWHFSYGDRLWAQISRFGHDDATRAHEQVARADYAYVAVIDSPLFETVDARGGVDPATPSPMSAHPRGVQTGSAMRSWLVSLRLALSTAILLVAVLVMPSSAQAHASHAHAVPTTAHAGHADEVTIPAAAIVTAVEAMEAGQGTSRGRLHGACGGPCCNIACSTGCVSHALSGSIAALPPTRHLLARLSAPREALPTDPPKRRLPKPPRA